MDQVSVFNLIKRVYGQKPDHLRLGQWAFICLNEISHESATQITGTENDPFYHDDRVDKMFSFLLLRGPMPCP